MVSLINNFLIDSQSVGLFCIFCIALMSVLKNPSVLLFSHPSWVLKDNLLIAGRVQAPGRDRAELLPRPGEARQAAQLPTQGAET